MTDNAESRWQVRQAASVPGSNMATGESPERISCTKCGMSFSSSIDICPFCGHSTQPVLPEASTNGAQESQLSGAANWRQSVIEWDQTEMLRRARAQFAKTF